MQNIVKIINNQATTTSLDVAKGTHNEHRTVLQLIKNHKKRFLKFGSLTPEYIRSPNGGGRPTRYFKLNKAQATLLLTMMKHRPMILDIKQDLVDVLLISERLINNELLEMLTEMAQANDKYQSILKNWKRDKEVLQRAIERIEIKLQPQLPFGADDE